MYTLRRWWDRHRIQIVLVSLTLGVALLLRQTQGTVVFELYQLLSRPFHLGPSQPERIENARVLELQERLIELESQNQELKKVLGYAAENTQTRQEIAPVIGLSSDHWWQQVTLGRGSRDGIQIGYIVMAPGGLVGRIVHVTPSTSRVLLLSDPANQVGVTVSRSRAMGFIRGQASNRVVMEFFDKVPDVKRGDVIATSAFSKLFPSGLPIGRVETVDFSKSPAPEAVIELSAPISHLEWVTVRPNQATASSAPDAKQAESSKGGNSLNEVARWHPMAQAGLNWLVTAGSVLVCLLILPTRLPGMELAGIGPNWLLIWVVAWSIKRPVFQGALAGLALGLIQDGMTAPFPSHALSLTLVGFLTARIRKERYIQEDFISVALIVFGMAVLAETVTAIQFMWQGTRTLPEIWAYHQLIALSSAILSSLWAPVIYFPLNRWWQWVNSVEQS